MSLDIALSSFYVCLAAALVAAMAAKRIFYSSPLFFVYVCFDLLSTIAGVAIYHYSGFSVWYLRYFFIGITGDFLLYLFVLPEIGKNLLRANRKSRPHWSLAVLLFAAASVLVSVLSRWTGTSGRSPLANLCFVGMRVDAALEFSGFLALISWSNLRKLQWTERQLRIATGFGFLTFISFLIALLLFQWSTGPVYHWLYVAGQAANLATLAYWLHYFWTIDRGSLARVKIRKSEDAERTVSR